MKKVLITSGPTSVPVDEMRVITNRSTGEMGRLLARAFAASGSKVVLLEGAVTTNIALPKGIVVKKFYFFSDLEKALSLELKKKPDVVVHAAAVSDFTLKRSFKGKLPSVDKIRLDLVPTRKLVNGIKKASPNTQLVGFKFEPALRGRHILKKTRSLFTAAGCDIVVANSMRNGKYRACLVTPDGGMTRQIASKANLVKQLVTMIGRCIQ